MLQTRPWRELAEDFVRIEAMGYDVAYVADHLTHPLMPGRWLGDGATVLAAAATRTRHLGLGTLVASAAYRTPVPLARLAATLDDVTDGRLVLGLGAGSAACVRADRNADVTPAQLARRYADVVAGLAAVWAGERAWSGTELAFSDVETLPLVPGRRAPFLLLAAHGEAGLDLVARYGDGWSTYGGPTSTTLPAEEYWALLGAQRDRLHAACDRHDRDPAGLRRSLLLGFGTVHPLGSPAAYVDAVRRAEDLGFDEVVVYWSDGAAGSRFWSDPRTHEQALATLRG